MSGGDADGDTQMEDNIAFVWLNHLLERIGGKLCSDALKNFKVQVSESVSILESRIEKSENYVDIPAYLKEKQILQCGKKRESKLNLVQNGDCTCLPCRVEIEEYLFDYETSTNGSERSFQSRLVVYELNHNQYFGLYTKSTIDPNPEFVFPLGDRNSLDRFIEVLLKNHSQYKNSDYTIPIQQNIEDYSGRSLSTEAESTVAAPVNSNSQDAEVATASDQLQPGSRRAHNSSELLFASSKGFPKLSVEMIKVVMSAWGPGPENEVLNIVNGQSLTRRDLLSLYSCNWTNENIIDVYMFLIAERNSMQNFASVYCFKVEFWLDLKQWRMSKMSKWKLDLNIFSYDIIFIPVFEKCYVGLIVIDKGTKKVELYDATLSTTALQLNNLYEYLFKLNPALKSYAVLPILEKREGLMLESGLYMLNYAENRARNMREVSFPENVEYYRCKIAYELLSGELINEAVRETNQNQTRNGTRRGRMPSAQSVQPLEPVNLQSDTGIICIKLCSSDNDGISPLVIKKSCDANNKPLTEIKTDRLNISDEINREQLRLQLSTQELSSLDYSSNLSIQVVDAYLALIADRSKQDSFPSVCVYSPYFLKNLFENGLDSVFEETNTIDIFSYNLLLFPLFFSKHWSLIAINNDCKKVLYLTSSKNEMFPHLGVFNTYMIFESSNRMRRLKYETEIVNNLPQQNSPSDSGVFLLVFAEHLSRNAEITFHPELVSYFRRKIAFELQTCELFQQITPLEQISTRYEVPSNPPEASIFKPKQPDMDMMDIPPNDEARKFVSSQKKGGNNFQQEMSSDDVLSLKLISGKDTHRSSVNCEPLAQDIVMDITSDNEETVTEQEMEVDILEDKIVSSNDLKKENIIEQGMEVKYITKPQQHTVTYSLQKETHLSTLHLQKISSMLEKEDDDLSQDHKELTKDNKLLSTNSTQNSNKPTDFENEQNQPSDPSDALSYCSSLYCDSSAPLQMPLAVVNNYPEECPETSVNFEASNDKFEQYPNPPDHSVRIKELLFPIPEYFDPMEFFDGNSEFSEKIHELSKQLTTLEMQSISDENLGTPMSEVVLPKNVATEVEETSNHKQANPGDVMCEAEVLFKETRKIVPMNHLCLSKEKQKIFNSIFQTNKLDEVLCHVHDIGLLRKDLQRLQGARWLNDELINSYLYLLSDRSAKNKNLPSLYTCSTFFMFTIEKKKKIRKKKKNQDNTSEADMLLYDIILIPINVDGNHWALICVDTRSKTIKFYDSFSQNGDIYLEKIRNYIYNISENKSPDNAYSLDNDRNIPRQVNGVDCGVFTLLYADCLSRDARMDFSQEEIPCYREKIAQELVNGLLLEEGIKLWTGTGEKTLKEHYSSPVLKSDCKSKPPMYSKEGEKVAKLEQQNDLKHFYSEETLQLKLDERDYVSLYDTSPTSLVIDLYFSQLYERGKKETFPSVFIFKDTFYKILAEQAPVCALKYKNNVNIFSYDLVLVPICLDHHWSLLVIDNTRFAISYYDSKYKNGNESLKIVEDYLITEMLENNFPLGAENYKLENVDNLPQEENEEDSAVFMLLFAEFVTRDAEILLTGNLKYYRKQMMWELMESYLVNSKELWDSEKRNEKLQDLERAWNDAHPSTDFEIASGCPWGHSADGFSTADRARELRFPQFQPDGKYLPQFLLGNLTLAEVMSVMKEKEEKLIIKEKERKYRR